MGDDYAYEVLDINKDGSGPYHVNRFSIVFYPHLGDTLDTIATDFKERFASYFNGFGSANSGRRNWCEGIPNIASVSVTDEKRRKQSVYSFVLKNPGFHADFVCEVENYKKNYRENEAPGFAFETLHRFDLRTETFMMQQVDPMSGIGPDLDATHVLAGRRSWNVFTCHVIKKTDIVFISGSSNGRQKRHKPFAPNEACVIQTAAIERYSGVISRAAGALMDDRSIVDRIWSNQLVNFVRMNNYKFWSRSLKAFRDRPGELSWDKNDKASSGVLDTVFVDKRSFPVGQKKTMYSDPFVKGVVSAHPALKEQFKDWK